MLGLPTEIITIIARFLEPKERIKLRKINTLLNEILSNHQLWRDVNNEFARNRFQKMCKIGNLHSAQWITQYFDLTREDVRSNNNYALRYSCENGHLEVTQWLTQYFNLTQEDARSNDNYALRWSRRNGHAHIIDWLKNTFGIS